MTLLDQLKTMTKVVADTGDFESIHQFSPSDATTNPSLILKAAKQEKYKHLLVKARADYKMVGARTPSDYLVVLFGLEILKIKNIKQGPILGEIIDALKEAQISGEVNTKDDAIGFVRKYKF